VDLYGDWGTKIDWAQLFNDVEIGFKDFKLGYEPLLSHSKMYPWQQGKTRWDQIMSITSLSHLLFGVEKSV
jgi:hypothetical protein